MRPPTLRERRAAAFASQRPILVDEEEAAFFLGLGRTTIQKMRAMGTFPPPVEGLPSSKCVLFLFSDIELAAKHGFPDEATFRRIKEG